MISTDTRFYFTGGNLERDAPSYVARQADTDLYEGLARGEFCYVLTSRQMGKSSLMARTAARLRQEGIAVVALDLTAIGQNVSVEQWYWGVLGLLGHQLDLEDELDGFWLAHQQLGPLQRWMAALREIVLMRVPGRVAIFIDEIDYVRSLPFSTDEFFAGIRECYNRRTEDPEFRRLTFCLLGVASPSDLIRDSRTTPFNIGRRIQLHDFSEGEAMPLARGLDIGEDISTKTRRYREEEARALLRRVLQWTGGHPYLTQRLCQAVADASDEPSRTNAARGEVIRRKPRMVDRLCEELFLSRAPRDGDHLQLVPQRLLQGHHVKGGPADPASLLDLYARVHRTTVWDDGPFLRALRRAGLLGLYGRARYGPPVRDDDTNPLIEILRLSGMIRVVDGALQVRNRIYQRVFDWAWVAEHMPDAEVRRQRAAFRRGLVRAGAVAGPLVAVMTGLTGFAWSQRNQTRAASRRADRQTTEARRLASSLRLALDEEARARRDLEQALAVAQHERRRADHEATAAESARGKAERARQQADKSAAGARPQERVARAAGAKERAACLRGARLLYDADMQLAARAWEDGATQRASELLAAHEPKPGEEDFRGFDWRYQWKLLNGSAVTFRRHGGGVTHGALTPDGALVTLDEELQLRHWDRATRRARRTVSLPPGSDRYGMALSHDGRTLAVRTSAGDIRLLDTATGRTKRRLKGHPAGAVSPESTVDPFAHVIFWLAFSGNDKELVALGDCDRTARVWDVATGEQTHLVTGLNTDLLKARVARDVALSPDGKTLALAEHPVSSYQIALLDVRKRVAQESLLGSLSGHGGTVTSVADSPDGRTAASGDMGGQVILWDPVTRQERRRLSGHSAPVLKMAFSPDGRTLATGSWDTRVKLWDVATGRELRALTGHTASITFLAFSADSKTLATGSQDGTAKLWDLSTSNETRVLAGHANDISGIAYSPDGRLLATASWDRTAKLWDARTGRLLHTLPLHKWAVTCVVFSPDGRTLATGGFESEVKLWDVATGRERRTLGELAVSHRPWYGRPVGSLAFSPDGRWLAAGFGHPSGWYSDYKPVLKVWDVANPRKVRSLQGHRNSIGAIAFSPDGKMMATGSQDRTVKLWKVGHWREVRTLSGFSDRVHSVAFSPSGRTLAVGAYDGSIKLCETVTGRETRALKGHGHAVYRLVFSPDDKTLATGSWDHTVRLWDVVSGRETRTFPVNGLAVFSHDGDTLATGGDTTDTVRLREAASQQEIASWGAEERAAERQLAAARAREPLGPATLAWHRRIAVDCRRKQQWSAALSHLDRLIQAHPAVWRDRVDRGRALARLNRWNEAEAEFARSVPPTSSDSERWIERGSVYAELGRWDKVATDFGRALDRGTGDPLVWYRRALSGVGAGESDAYRRVRERLLARVVARKPNDPEVWIERGRVHAERGQWGPSAADFSRALALGTGPRESDAWISYEAALARLGVGDTDGYRDACARTLERFGGTDDGDTAWAVATACALAPNAVNDPMRPIQLAEKAIAAEGKYFGPNWRYRATLALAVYRAGRFELALQKVSESMAASPEGNNGSNWLLLAMAHYRLGHVEKARRWFRRGIGWHAGAAPDWHDRLLFQLLRREAATLIRTGQS